MTGEEMRAIRERHGLSRRELAEILGTTDEAIRAIERYDRRLSDTAEARLSEWRDQDGKPPAAAPADGDGEPAEGDDDGRRRDALPEPPYNPADQEPDDDADGDTEKPKRTTSRRRSTGTTQRKRLTPWQEQTAASLIGVFQGTLETIEVDGNTHQFQVPGLCHLIAKADPFDAQIVYQGIPGLAVATVKIAPRHPWLKGALDMASAGGDYRELIQASMAIIVPIALHHGLLGGQPAPVVDGQAAEVDPTKNGHGGA